MEREPTPPQAHREPMLLPLIVWVLAALLVLAGLLTFVFIVLALQPD